MSSPTKLEIVWGACVHVGAIRSEQDAEHTIDLVVKMFPRTLQEIDEQMKELARDRKFLEKIRKDDPGQWGRREWDLLRRLLPSKTADQLYEAWSYLYT